MGEGNLDRKNIEDWGKCADELDILFWTWHRPVHLGQIPQYPPFPQDRVREIVAIMRKNLSVKGHQMTKTFYELTQDLLWRLRRQYPLNDATFSRCDHCQGQARGGGLCAGCLTEELGAILSEPDLAHKYNDAYKRAFKLEAKLLKMAEKMDNLKDKEE